MLYSQNSNNPYPGLNQSNFSHCLMLRRTLHKLHLTVIGWSEEIKIINDKKYINKLILWLTSPKGDTLVN
jgi:hypothetical protein